MPPTPPTRAAKTMTQKSSSGPMARSPTSARISPIKLWKFGLLGRDFLLRTFRRIRTATRLWATVASGGRSRRTRIWTRRDRSTTSSMRDRHICKTSSSRAFARSAFHEQADRSIHLSYESSRSLPAAPPELGYVAERGRREETLRRSQRPQGPRRESRRFCSTASSRRARRGG